MKKKINLILIVLTLVIFSVSCQPYNEADVSLPPQITQGPTGEESGGTFSPMEAPTQPIGFLNFEEALSFVSKGDCSKYRQDDQPVYEAMIQVFKNDGALYRLSHNEYDSPKEGYSDAVTLYPEQNLEDVGIGYWFEGTDMEYLVLIYCVQEGKEYTLDLQAESLFDYWKKRFNVNTGTAYRTVHTSNPKLSELYTGSVPRSSDDRAAFWAALDEQHYIGILADATDQQIIDFVNALLIERVLIS